MAISVKSTYGDPEYFRYKLDVGGTGPARVDAAPFYEGLRLKATLEGSSIVPVGNFERHYSYNYTFEETYSRVPTQGSPVDGIGTFVVNDLHEGGSIFALSLNPPPEGCCLIQVRTGHDQSHLPIRFVITPYDRPPVIIGSYDTYYTGGGGMVFMGTTDVYSSMWLDPPEFTWIGSETNRERDNGWGFPYNYVDISGWTMAQWRDLRGVHTLPGVPVFGLPGITATEEFEVF